MWDLSSHIYPFNFISKIWFWNLLSLLTVLFYEKENHLLTPLSDLFKWTNSKCPLFTLKVTRASSGILEGKGVVGQTHLCSRITLGGAWGLNWGWPKARQAPMECTISQAQLLQSSLNCASISQGVVILFLEKTDFKSTKIKKKILD